jgi:hypothetical protein
MDKNRITAATALSELRIRTALISRHALARIIHEGVGRNEQLAMLPELRSLTKRRMAHNVLERV